MVHNLQETNAGVVRTVLGAVPTQENFNDLEHSMCDFF
jgi:hypothetical protein